MEMKESSSWNWKGKEGAGISHRNSTLDVEEGKKDGEKMSGSKCGVTGEGESWIGEGMWDKIWEIQDRI